VENEGATKFSLIVFIIAWEIEGGIRMIKIYVLDTNVLIHDPKALFKFEDNLIVLPIYVIEEIDKLKREQHHEIGRNARLIARIIDEIREKGSLADWVDLEGGGKIKVELKGSGKDLPSSMKRDVMDNRILSVAKEVQHDYPDKEVILVTKDINMRIKADSLSIKVENYENDTVDISDLYSGNQEVMVSEEKINRFYDTGHLNYQEVVDKEPLANEFVTLISNENPKHQAIAIYKKPRKRLNKLVLGETYAWGIRGRNKEQRCAIELLMDPEIKLVTLVGKAGTGKTLLALACGLEEVVERSMYKKLFVARPIMPMGKDLGYLPGSEKDKLRPWMQPIYDNFEFLSDNKEAKESHQMLEYLESKGLLKVEALTYIRGRSIPAGFLIIDEAQNLTPHEIKTVVTRAGENTKLVFTGDPYQIDNPYLDSNSNGLTYLAERLKNEEISGHITLIKGERSELAEIASKLL